MAFPTTSGLSKNNLDQSTDSPAAALAEIEAVYDKMVDMINSYADANGICDLDSNQRVPASRMPSPLAATTALSCSGNSSTATKLKTARTIALSGDASGSIVFDGSANKTMNVSVNNDSHTHGASSLSANSVGQSQIKTAYQQLEQQFTGPVDFVATGGKYVLGHEFQRYAGVNSEPALTRKGKSSGVTSSSSYFADWTFSRGANTSSAYDAVRLHYISASPPYDLGDGEILLFAYAVIDNASSEILYSSVSPDPSWAYNGQTNIVPDRYGKDGKIYRIRKDMRGHPLTKKQAEEQGKLREYFQAFNAADDYEQEITQAIKNADMNDVPHPFVGNDLTGKTVVMLDPMSSVLQEMLEWRNHDSDDGFSLSENVVIGNTQLNRGAPSGILVPSLKWKKTK